MSSYTLEQLESLLPQCMVKDRHALRQAMKRLRGGKSRSARGRGNSADAVPAEQQGPQGRASGEQARTGSAAVRDPQALDKLHQRLLASLEEAEARRQRLPSVTYPAGLPVSERVDDIKAALSEHQVLVVAGETGSGKTTQLPKICLALGRGVTGRIAHTQPRRLAARSVASRLAEELNVELGREVGCQIRFTDNTSSDTLIKLMTDGILLAEIQHDPYLNQYDTIIIDEAHERSLNIDFLLGYIKRLLPRRPDLKVIITSATIDVEKFAAHFDQAPVIEVSGRTYPVELVYRPAEEHDEELDLPAQVCSAVEHILQRERTQKLPYGDVLVFLTGEKEIRDVALALRKAAFPHTEILPLYARLSASEQNRIFKGHTGRRIVLSTNVAETSLTVPGIGYVIDSGLVRISRYSVRSKVQRLPVEPISQASANQRAGRCGRLAPGVCIRLYSEEDFQGRPEFTDTEITRTNLAAVILQMLNLGLGEIERFPFVDVPETRAINDGFRLLEELGAIDNKRHLTLIGRQMARLPVDPRFGRMVLEAARLGTLREMQIIVSALSMQDPRERPLDKQQAADEKHARFAHPESDFLAFVTLWDSFEEERQALTQGQLRKYCQKHFLSWLRMREWRDLHRQLQLVCRDMKLSQNPPPQAGEGEPARLYEKLYEPLHRALLSGLLSQVANKLDDGAYLGARNRRYQLFPGSVLFRKKPRWILAAELVETTQLYARMNARIKPEWIEQQAPDFLLKKEYLEPFWSKKQGRVMAWEKVSLYGLVLVEKRRVAYGRIDPEVSRELFIREGLVAMQANTRVRSYRRNCELMERVRDLEDRTRRRDLLVDDTHIEHWYRERLPAEVIDVRSFERWYRQASQKDPDVLLMTEDDLTSDALDTVDLKQYPDRLQTPSLTLPLGYAFEPGKQSDGISVSVPLAALKQIREENLDWLVPGMLREKCIALVKALPKSLRKHFVPVPDTVDRLLTRLDSKGEGDLRQQLAAALSRHAGLDIEPSVWNDFELPLHLQMNINVVDDQGKTVSQGRDLRGLQHSLANDIQDSLSRQVGGDSPFERPGLQAWEFDDLPEVHEITRAGLRLLTYPALVDEGESVRLTLLDNAWRAEQQTRLGLVRLLMIRTPQQLRHLRKYLLKQPAVVLAMQPLGDQGEVLNMLVQSAYIKAFDLESALPRTRAAFEALQEKGRPELIRAGEQMEALLHDIMTQLSKVRKAMKQGNGLQRLPLNQAIEAQLAELMGPHFLRDTPVRWLQRFPVYLKAMQQRLERYAAHPEKDREFQRELDRLWQRYSERSAYCRQHELSDDALDLYRWMIEEYRVSLFAQQLGTAMPVSAKRLEKQWQAIGK